MADGLHEADIYGGIRVLREVDPVSAPSFVIGLSNALLAAMSDRSENPELRAELLDIRRAAIRKYVDQFIDLLRRIEPPYGSWLSPDSENPETPKSPLLDDCLRQIANAGAEAMQCEPQPSPPAPWKERDWVSSYISRNSHLVHKLKAKDTTGRWAYYFVLVTGEREAEFLEAIEGDSTVDLEDYGVVIASCYGEYPDQEVTDYLREKYGIVL